MIKNIKTNFKRNDPLKFLFFGIASVGIWTFIYFNKDNHDRIYIEKLTEQTLNLSAGEDKFWSTGEQLSFLRDNGLENAVIKESPIFDYKSDKVEVYDNVSGNYSLNPKNYLGTIKRETLEAYVQRNGQ